MGRPALAGAAVPSPFCFPSLSIGSASCRNFSPSGWQPQQVPAWGGLAAMKAERREDRGLLPASLLTVHGDVDAPYTPLPRTNTQVLLFRKILDSSGQQQAFFSLPQLLCGSCAEIAFTGFRA